jgi:hypothetical protein
MEHQPKAKIALEKSGNSDVGGAWLGLDLFYKPGHKRGLARLEEFLQKYSIQRARTGGGLGEAR